MNQGSFSFYELLARIRALLRGQGASRETVLKVKDMTLDTNTHVVTRDGKPIELTAKEYAVLEYFMRNKGRLLTRSQIADHVV
ncbi:DNA-binding response regulator [Biomaibacter acetigenes]|uniref:DNA-binding response regulator n=1 Tax=Biomaibacter acetigenes TaxID=2316383 RepID=A0A3G2R7Y7_9FIRM|nr:DNA-binding response regulator [Biomaibacter acetigenes]